MASPERSYNSSISGGFKLLISFFFLRNYRVVSLSIILFMLFNWTSIFSSFILMLFPTFLVFISQKIQGHSSGNWCLLRPCGGRGKFVNMPVSVFHQLQKCVLVNLYNACKRLSCPEKHVCVFSCYFLFIWFYNSLQSINK